VLLVCPWSRRCASGWSVPTSRRADPPGDRPTGLRGGEGAHTAVDQSDRQAALRHGGVGVEAFFGARTSRRISDRGGAARDRPPEAMQQSQHRSVQQTASYYNDAERAQGRAASLGLQGNCQLTISCHPIAGDIREGGRISTALCDLPCEAACARSSDNCQLTIPIRAEQGSVVKTSLTQ
jgi:hypothetical protein